MAAVNLPDNPANGTTSTVNGITYTYNSSKGYWTAASSGGGGGGGASVSTSDAAPGSASDGDLWYDTDDGGMFVYYQDTDSSQWVEVIGSQGAAGPAGAAGATTAGMATVYATVDALPMTGNTQGDMAHVTATNTLYFWNGSGWYKIALINTNPSISGVASAYALATDGTATTVTITATDPEGLPITYSIVSDTSGNIASVSQGTGASTNVFTITPSTNQAYAGSFTLTFRASDGVNIATAPATFTLQFSVQNSKYTSLLLTTDGSTGGITTFTDSSSNSHTVTANGNAAQTTFSPYRAGGYSAYFNGTTDYLQVPDSSTLDLPADFTIEFWMYREGDTSGTYQAILGGNGSTSNGWNFYVTNSNNILSFFHTSFLINGPAIEDHRWYHVALTRSGTTLTMYVDGTSVGTATTSTSFDQSTANAGTRIGYDNGANGYFHGYLTDIRVVQGTAVYTAAFTPPTERLTAITNTSLLACHLPYFADGSTNGHTITPNGSVATNPFSPYDSTSEYTVGTHGGSAYFDGTVDYLSLPTAAGNLGTGDFTVELWAYHDDATLGSQTYIDTRQTSGTDGWLLYVIGGAEYIRFYANGSSVLLSPASAVVRKNAWNHIALTRASGTIRLFVNGKEQGSTSSTADLAAYNFNIGAKTYTASGAIPMQGNISDVRISTNARYTADFTPPTTAFTNDSNTQLLVNMQDSVIIDKSQSIQNLTLAGDTTASTAEYKYLPSSIYFDGTGDYIQLEGLDDRFYGDFTVEMWVKFNTYNSGSGVPNSRIFVSRQGGNNADNLQLIIDYTGTNGSIDVWTNTYHITDGTTNIADNNWHHVAVSRQGTSMKLFIDGTQEGSTATTSQSFLFWDTRLGARDNTADAGTKYTGYMSDVRITKGLARYTANFTPPTAALQG